jgi:hypothetical protein
MSECELAWALCVAGWCFAIERHTAVKHAKTTINIERLYNQSIKAQTKRERKSWESCFWRDASGRWAVNLTKAIVLLDR